MQDKIIEEIIADKQILAVCKKVAGQTDLAFDLFNEIVLIFCEMPDDKLTKLYQDKLYFKYYIIRTIYNTWFSRTSPFARKYSRDRKTEEFTDDIEVVNDEIYNYESDLKLAKLERELNKMSWYDRRLFYEYLEAGSCRKLAEKTGIHFTSIYKTVKKVKEILKNSVDDKRAV